MLLLLFYSPPDDGSVGASSATTSGADTLAANAAPIVSASSAKTDGADALVSNVAPVVAAAVARTDGADVLAAVVASSVAASVATTDGADSVAAAVAPIVGALSASTDGADVLAAEVALGSEQPARAPAGHGASRQSRRVAIEAHGRILTFETEEEAEAWLADQEPKQAKVIRKIARKAAQASGPNMLAGKPIEYVAPQLLHGSQELRALVEMRAALLKAKFTDEAIWASKAQKAIDEEEGMMAALLMMAMN